MYKLDFYNHDTITIVVLHCCILLRFIVSGSSGQSYDVFISYCREEGVNTVVDQIAACLEQVGLRAFVDRKSLKPGDIWPAEVVNAINTCKAFVAVLTKKYIKSHYCQGELYEAEALGKPFYPVVLEEGWDEEIAGIPVKAVVQSFQYAFLSRSSPEPEKLHELSTNILKKVKPESKVDNTCDVK